MCVLSIHSTTIQFSHLKSWANPYYFFAFLIHGLWFGRSYKNRPVVESVGNRDSKVHGINIEIGLCTFPGLSIIIGIEYLVYGPLESKGLWYQWTPHTCLHSVLIDIIGIKKKVTRGFFCAIFRLVQTSISPVFWVRPIFGTS